MTPPRCCCVHYGPVRVLEHRLCPQHGRGGDRWRVVAVPMQSFALRQNPTVAHRAKR